jgi:hypothetical protein
MVSRVSIEPVNDTIKVIENVAHNSEGCATTNRINGILAQTYIKL